MIKCKSCVRQLLGSYGIFNFVRNGDKTNAAIGSLAALMLFASLFTNGINAETPKQNKTMSDEYRKKYDFTYYKLYKDPKKVTEPPAKKAQEKTKFKTSDGMKLLTKSKGTPKKAKTGIKRG